MNGFSKTPNIGNVLANRLAEINISNLEELCATGSREAFLRLQLNDPSTCINTLYALEGAVQNIRWHQLDAQIKKELQCFFRDHNID